MATDQQCILFAFSQDKGKTWVGPTNLSEQPAEADADYSAYMPAIAVNKDGAVAVTWYDRRGLPNIESKIYGKRYPVGCNVRFRVSLDGGETWHASVQVNEKPIQASVKELRDTMGLAADAAGAFHPVWIDDRTGTLQVLTVTIRVRSR